MIKSVDNAREFMCIQKGDVMKVIGFGSSAFGKYKVLSEPQQSEIPKILVKSLQEDQRNEPPLFLYYVENSEGKRVLTDKSLPIVCGENEKLEILVWC